MNIIEYLKINKNVLHIFLIVKILILIGIYKNTESIINNYENIIKIILFLIIITILLIFKFPEPKKIYYFITQILHYIVCVYIIYVFSTNNIQLVLTLKKSKAIIP